MTGPNPYGPARPYTNQNSNNGFNPGNATNFQQKNTVKPQAAPVTAEDVIEVLKTKPITILFTPDQISQIARAFAKKDVSDIHKYSDFNINQLAIHHTLGPSDNQASPGGHSHDGGTSIQLLAGTSITGSRSTATAAVLAQVITALTLLGATDATSP